MGRISLRERIHRGLFLLDGAMGTELIARGIEAGRCNDYLNIESPDIVFDIHRAYLEAGSDAVLTNTFGANKYALARHSLAEKVKEINTAAAQIARRVAGEEKYVLGDIGRLCLYDIRLYLGPILPYILCLCLWYDNILCYGYVWLA